MGRKIAKIKINHNKMKEFLDLPDDVTITSIYTKRPTNRRPRDSYSYVYVTCDRFNEIDEYEVAPEILFRDAKNDGMWDMENND